MLISPIFDNYNAIFDDYFSIGGSIMLICFIGLIVFTIIEFGDGDGDNDFAGG